MAGKGKGAAPKIRSGRNRTKHKRRLMSELRAIAEHEGLDTSHLRTISPAEALQECLDRAYTYMVYFANQVANLKPDELFIETEITDSGTTIMEPHYLVTAEANARQEVSYLAGRALDIGLESKRVDILDRAADAIAMMIEGVMEELDLNTKQRRAVGPAIRRQLELMSQGMPALPTPRPENPDIEGRAA